MSTQEHLNSGFLTLLILLMLHEDEISQEQKERAKTHLPDCQECGRRLVALLLIAGEETRIPLITSALHEAALTSLDADEEIREIFAECVRRYA